MIRLRREIERGLRHPLVGPLLLVFLAVLVVFIALHETSDSIAGHVALICVAIAIVLLAAVSLAGVPHPATRSLGTNPPRGPPSAYRRLSTPGTDTSDFHPLRL